jgi:hypothetical protein
MAQIHPAATSKTQLRSKKYCSEWLIRGNSGLEVSFGMDRLSSEGKNFECGLQECLGKGFALEWQAEGLRYGVWSSARRTDLPVCPDRPGGHSCPN